MISRIEGSGPIQTATPIRRAKKTSATGKSDFSEHLEGAEEASATQSAGALGAVSGVLNIQEVDDALARAAKGKLRAEDLLNKLDELRLDLLEGTLSRTKLVRLAEIVNARRPDISDPHLAGVLDEIDLRAQVELAKFTR